MHKYNEALLRRNAREIRRRIENVIGLLEDVLTGEENLLKSKHSFQIIGTNINVIRSIYAQNKGIQIADKNFGVEANGK